VKENEENKEKSEHESCVCGADFAP